MRYILGVDGGGTKTDLVLCREDGSCCGRVVEGGSNHQLVGLEQAAAAILRGVERLLAPYGADDMEIAGACLGLSGADLPEDIRALENALAPLKKRAPFHIINDVWLPLTAMVPTGCGAVSICGTGHNTALRKENGETLQIGALSYALGNWGGGEMLAEHAMHAAARALEHTGAPTALTEALPPLYGQKDMLSLQRHLYLTGHQGLYRPEVGRIVTELARAGDAVCIGLLERDGRIQGEMTAGLIAHAGLREKDVPVVLAGGLYLKDVSGRLRGAYEAELRRRCPRIRIVTLTRPPAAGAALLALQAAGLLDEASKARAMESIQ